MFLYPIYPIRKNSIHKITLKTKQLFLFSQKKRKEKFSPRKISILQGIRTFFSAPLQASLTVEAACVLPLFLFVMITVLQYGILMETSVRFGTAMTETGKRMSLAAYVSQYGGEQEKTAEIAVSAFSAAYAHYSVKKQMGDTSGIKNANMALSTFLKEDEMIDLVLTYQIRTPFSSIKLPGNFFIQRAQVRAWTGRVPRQNGGGAENEKNDAGEYVYVTDTGNVYHKDEKCSHLNLSIREVSMQSLDILRNGGGGIYHACEFCGAHAGNSVYITNHGDRYHSTLSCSGLKRTVKQLEKEKAEGMRACSRCGG